jgi:hypothetical protein
MPEVNQQPERETDRTNHWEKNRCSGLRWASKDCGSFWARKRKKEVFPARKGKREEQEVVS